MMKDGTKTFTLRLTPREHELLAEGAKERNSSKNQFIVYLMKSYQTINELQEKVSDIQSKLHEIEEVQEWLAKK